MKRKHRGRIHRWRVARKHFDEQMQRWLGVSAAEAVRMLDAGELRGTLAAIEIEIKRALVDEEPPT